MAERAPKRSGCDRDAPSGATRDATGPALAGGLDASCGLAGPLVVAGCCAAGCGLEVLSVAGCWSLGRPGATACPAAPCCPLALVARAVVVSSAGGDVIGALPAEGRGPSLAAKPAGADVLAPVAMGATVPETAGALVLGWAWLVVDTTGILSAATRRPGWAPLAALAAEGVVSAFLAVTVRVLVVVCFFVVGAIHAATWRSGWAAKAAALAAAVAAGTVHTTLDVGGGLPAVAGALLLLVFSAWAFVVSAGGVADIDVPPAGIGC